MAKKEKAKPTRKVVAHPKVWHKVKAPRKWFPEIGEELVGEYIGTSERDGQYGKYNVYFLKSSGGLIRYVSGTLVNDLFALVPIGTKVRIVFLGEQQSKTTGQFFKLFELYTEEEIQLRVTG